MEFSRTILGFFFLISQLQSLKIDRAVSQQIASNKLKENKHHRDQVFYYLQTESRLGNQK